MAEGDTDGRRERSSMSAVFDRVNVVESGMSNLREQIATVSTNLLHLSAQLNRMTVTLEQRSSTDWKSLASWAGVVLAIVGVFLSQVIAPIKQATEMNATNIGRINDARLADSRQNIADIQLRLAQAEQVGRDRERIEQNRRQLDKLESLIDSQARRPPP